MLILLSVHLTKLRVFIEKKIIWKNITNAFPLMLMLTKLLLNRFVKLL